MLGKLTIKATSSWLGYKRSEAKVQAMEVLEYGQIFHNRLKVLETTTVA